MLSTFKPLNAMYSKFERLKISGRTFVRLKSGVPGWGDLSQSSPPKILIFKSLELEVSEWVDIRTKLNLTKIEAATTGVFTPNNFTPKFELFTLST